jgi:hypothetical protein
MQNGDFGKDHGAPIVTEMATFQGRGVLPQTA